MDPSQPNTEPNQQYFQNSAPMGPAPVSPVNPTSPNGSVFVPPVKQPKRRLPVVLVILTITNIILIAAIFGLVLSSPDNNKVVSPLKTDTSGVSPATNIDIESINNGLSQDIGSLNNDEDFPTNKLDDKSLGL